MGSRLPRHLVHLLLSLVSYIVHDDLGALALADSFRLVSWNLLAPLYAPPQKYPHCLPHHLDWQYRQSLIVTQLQDLNPDIICLQEVQISCWGEFQRTLLDNDDNWTSYLQNVTRGHPVANAVFIRRNVAQALDMESRSRAMIVVLQLLQGSSRIVLANVHLEAGVDADDTRFCQIQSLLKRMQHYQRTYSCDHIVIVGDFNILASNPIYHLLTTGNLPPNHGLTTAMSKHQQITLPCLPLIHVCLPVQQTYAGGSILDYLWTSNRIKHAAISTHRNVPRRRYAWPNAEHPSDHLPIGANLSIEDKDAGVTQL